MVYLTLSTKFIWMQLTLQLSKLLCELCWLYFKFLIDI